MKQKYKFCFILSILALSLSVYADESKLSYKKSIEKWNKANFREYSARIRFSAFSPLSGIWDIDVKNGNIYNCRLNGKAADMHKKFAEMLTIENIYKTYCEGFISGENGPFIIKATYGKDGFINSLTKTRNPQYKNKVKTDSVYKIEVLDITSGER